MMMCNKTKHVQEEYTKLFRRIHKALQKETTILRNKILRKKSSNGQQERPSN